VLLHRVLEELVVEDTEVITVLRVQREQTDLEAEGEGRVTAAVLDIMDTAAVQE
jgi:hypothetical protein